MEIAAGLTEAYAQKRTAHAFVKRTIDLIIAVPGFLIILPLLAIIALVVRLDSPGPAVFRQVRVGQDGRRFVMVKFRGMYRDARQRWPEFYAYRYTDQEARDLLFHPVIDPRVTRVGRVIRKWSLDELPNLWNVITGDMSIVGPRPDIPELIPYYGTDAREFLSVKPGVTGLSKVSGRDQLRLSEMISLELRYVRDASLMLDLKIILATIGTVVLQRGILPGLAQPVEAPEYADRIRRLPEISLPVATSITKRAVDIVLGAALLVALSPVIALVAVLVVVTTGWPPFYRQQRVGRMGRPFSIWKFRTMHRDAHARRHEIVHLNESHPPTFKVRRDPRITPFGRFLRRSSLDEVPNLFNVVAGQMSLVGPRPPLPEEVEAYDDAAFRRLTVRPGLTCTWQVESRYHSIATFTEWVQLDVDYIHGWSLTRDAGLLLRTVGAVLRMTGS